MKIYLILIFLLLGCALKEKRAEDIAKISVGNWNGQKTLYKKGWLLIPSAERSLTYSYKNTISTAQDAYDIWGEEFVKDNKNFLLEIDKIPGETKTFIQNFNKLAIKSRKKVFRQTDTIVQGELNIARSSFAKAYKNILLGSVQVGDLTELDRKQVSRRVLGYKNDVKKDMRTIKEMTSFLKSQKSEEVVKTWKESSNLAAQEWGREYRKSVEQKNTLMALPYVLWGNLKALWYGVAAPSAEYTFHGGKFIAKQGMRIFKKGVLLPVGGALAISGRTVWNTGGALYYTGKMGVKVVSKYVEAGLLTSLGILSTASTVPTYLTGKSLGFFSQLGMQSTGVAAGASLAIGKGAKEVTSLSAKYFYNTVKGSGRVIFGGAKVAVVLGYNALTALPAQVLLSSINSVWFLAWDGPRLALYSVQGKIKDSDVNQLPIGSVLNLEQAVESGLKVKEVHVEDKVLQKVLRSLPRDLQQ